MMQMTSPMLLPFPKRVNLPQIIIVGLGGSGLCWTHSPKTLEHFLLRVVEKGCRRSESFDVIYSPSSVYTAGFRHSLESLVDPQRCRC